jgi:hypothetical protein
MVCDDSGALRKYIMRKLLRMGENSTYAPMDLEPAKLRHFLYQRVVLSQDPLCEWGCIVVVIHNPCSQLSFARVGAHQWTSIGGANMKDVTFHDGPLHAINYNGMVYKSNLNKSLKPKLLSRQWALSELHYDKMYLVSTPHVGLMLVSRNS